jgi:DNA invertase Pin-like site-specific DNA recombinase
MAKANSNPHGKSSQSDGFSTINRVALYARVSTVKDQSPEMQLRELREYAQRRGWTVTAEYVDHGVSGSKDTRPQLNKLMAAAHRREFDAIVCWKIDRFGRSLKHLVNALAELDAYGVAFVSLRDNLDLSTPQGRLMFGIIGCMAQFGWELIRERARAGTPNAKAKVVRIGRQRVHADASAALSSALKDFPGRKYAAVPN